MWIESLHWNTIFVYQELRKIPAYSLGEPSLLLIFQKSVQGNLILPIHINLREQVEFGSLFDLCKLFNLSIGSWLLRSELIAWECKNGEIR